MEFEPNLSNQERSFFEVVGPRLEQFAKEHNLKLEKWFKEIGIWELEFRHSLGGAAHVLIFPSGPKTAEIHSAWWLDDYDQESRRIASSEPRISEIWDPDLENALKDEIQQVLRWTESNLGGPDTMPVGMWHNYMTRQEFEESTASLPIPKL